MKSLNQPTPKTLKALNPNLLCMASQGHHLEKVAKEAFDMLDQCLGKQRDRHVYSYYQTKYFSIPPRKEGGVINSDEAAKLHGGVLLVGFPPQRKPSDWGFYT